MADSRHRTTFEINVDDRDVRGLGQTLDRAFDTKTIDAFERSLERSSRVMGKMIQQQTRLGQLVGRLQAREVRRDQIERQRTQENRPMGFFGTAGSVAVGNWLERRFQETRAGISAGVSGQGAASTIAGAVPIIGPVIQGAIQGIQRLYGIYLQQQGAMSQAFGATGLGRAQQRAFMGAASTYGVMPTAAPQLLAQFAQQTGMAGRSLADIAPTALRLQQLGGLNAAGGIVGAAGVAGGAPSSRAARDMMMDAVSAGLESGVREARLDRFLQGIANWVEGVRTQGIDLNVSSALEMVRGISALGPAFTGAAGLRVAQGLSQGLSQAADQPGVGSALLLRAAGFTGQPGGRSFLQAAEALEGPEQARIFSRFLQSTRGMGSSQARALFLRSELRRFGGQLSYRQARQMAEGDFPEMIFGGDDADEFLRRRRGPGIGLARPLGREARFQMREGALGGRVAGPAQRIRGLELQLAEMALPHIADFINRILQIAQAALRGVPGAAERLRRGVEQTRTDAVDQSLRMRRPMTVSERLQAAAAGAAAGLPLGPLGIAGGGIAGAVAGPDIRDLAADLLESVGRGPLVVGSAPPEGMSDTDLVRRRGMRHEDIRRMRQRQRQQGGGSRPSTPSEGAPAPAGGPGASEPSSALPDALRRARDALADAAVAAEALTQSPGEAEVLT